MFGAFLSSFLLAFVVLSFVMTIGLMVQIVGYVLDGIPASLVGRFALVSFPETLQWTMPLALLVAGVLVFSRLSADGEVAAMRACGINLLAVMKGPIAFALLCTALGCFVNNEVVPLGHVVRRNLKSRVSVEAGLDLLEPGRMIEDFPKVKLYFAQREGNWLHDLIVMDYSNPKVDRMITASKALVRQDGADVSLDLYQMTVDPMDEHHPTMARANRFRYVVKDAISEPKFKRKDKDLRFSELLASIREQRRLVSAASGSSRAKGTERNLRRRDLSKSRVELSKRFVFALASICFVLVGVPLGIKAQRRENSVGMVISLGVSLGYYMVVILMLSLQKDFAVHPEWLIFLPPLAGLALGAVLLRRHL